MVQRNPGKLDWMIGCACPTLPCLKDEWVMVEIQYLYYKRQAVTRLPPPTLPLHSLPALSIFSTGKYSSKATAKKRYLPRIAKLVSAFQVLKKDITSGR